MSKFEVYEHTFELNGEEYTIQPLTGKYLARMINAASAFQNLAGENGKLQNDIPADKLETFYDCVLATFKQSYPDMDKEKLEMFVSQNLLKLIEPVTKVSMSID